MTALHLSVRIGASADIPIRVETDTLQFTAITNMSKSAPLRVTAPDHGIPDGWRAAIQNAGTMTELNTPWDRLRDADLRRISVIDSDTIEFPGINSAGWRTYSGGGALAHYLPAVLSGYTAARMDIKEQAGGTVLASLDTTGGTIEIDAANSAVWLHVTPTTFAALAAGDYVFDIELIDGPDVIAFCSAESVLHLLPEITTST